MKWWWLIGALLVVMLAAGFVFLRQQKEQPPVAATIGDLRFEIAATPAAQAKGLGGRTDIPDNYAMLFVFPRDDRYGFWMLDMQVPIDIVWLDEAGTVVLIDHEVSPTTYPEVFYPPTPVRYVLETRAGYALDHGWEAGTHIPLPAPYGT